MEEFSRQIVKRAADNAGVPRRHFLRTAALASAGVAAAGAGLMVSPPARAQGTPSVLDVLQFALALEHLEAAFYEQATRLLLTRANHFADVNAIQLLRINFIVRTHEQTHEQGLAAAITCAGGTPVPRCEYTFPISDIPSYLQTAKALEETGVMAYLGAVPLLAGTPAVLVEASKIVTMEARHASVFRNLLGEMDPLSGTGAFPTCSGGFGNGAFDRLASIDEVKAKAAPFIASATCPPLKP